jgi:hypothetical protein
MGREEWKKLGAEFPSNLERKGVRSCHTEFKFLIKHLNRFSLVQEGKVDRANYTNFVSLNFTTSLLVQINTRVCVELLVLGD